MEGMRPSFPKDVSFVVLLFVVQEELRGPPEVEDNMTFSLHQMAQKNQMLDRNTEVTHTKHRAINMPV
jgi:hypothetical protein